MAEFMGLAKQIAAYAVNGGEEPDYFYQGYIHAGRFGTSTAERDPQWSDAQRKAYNQGFSMQQADKQAMVDLN